MGGQTEARITEGAIVWQDHRSALVRVKRSVCPFWKTFFPKVLVILLSLCLPSNLGLKKDMDDRLIARWASIKASGPFTSHFSAGCEPKAPDKSEAIRKKSSGNKLTADHWSLLSLCSVCQHGSFQCVFQPCPSMCTAYGDRHYWTFDGLLYDYIGVCKVYLVKVLDVFVYICNKYVPFPGCLTAVLLMSLRYRCPTPQILPL